MPSGLLRSQSTSSTPTSPLLSRGFASLRRSHRHTASATQPSTTPILQELKIRLVPNVGMTNRCFIFDVIDRTLQAGVILKLGRYSDRNTCSERLSFKSKVVSRCHAEIWQEGGKIYIKDTGSSSGTFVNRARLSPANTTSRPYRIQEGDLIQLGVDYKGGIQPMYRAVKIRFEIGPSTTQPIAFNRTAFRQLKQCLRTTPDEPSLDLQECCICLYAIAPGQALFITPCTHIYHYRCLRPLLTQNYPAFDCPFCRTYSDLDATVTIDSPNTIEDLLEPDLSSATDDEEPTRQPKGPDLATTLVASPAPFEFIIPPAQSSSHT